MGSEAPDFLALGWVRRLRISQLKSTTSSGIPAARTTSSFNTRIPPDAIAPIANSSYPGTPSCVPQTHPKEHSTLWPLRIQPGRHLAAVPGLLCQADSQRSATWKPITVQHRSDL